MTTLKPTLRFSEFLEDWKVKTLGDVSEIIMGQSPEGDTYNTIGNGVPLINGPVEFTGKYPVKIKWTSKPTKYCQDKDVLFCVRGSTTGRMNIANDRYCIGRGVAAIRANTQSTSLFIELLLINNLAEILSYTTGSTFQNIDSKSLKEFQTKLPTIPEQTKIANFLTATDQKIETLKEKKSQIQQYKKGIMQQLFSQELRFKNNNGEDFPDWEIKSLGEIFERIVSKNKENNLNVLTISAQQGLVNQETYFTKSVSAKDVTGYYLLNKGDFAYNKSYSKGYPMGAIKRLTKYEKGVVSTLYICFKLRNDDSHNYFEQYFESGFMNNELQNIAQEGARNHGLLNMSIVDFFKSIFMPYPSLPEQTKIANFLTAIDEKIEKINQQITETQTFKKGLLQQMFC